MLVTVKGTQAREVTYQTIGSGDQGVCAPANASACNITLSEQRVGIYILEIFVNGEQVLSLCAIKAARYKACV